MQLIVNPPGPVRCCLLKQDQVCGNRVCGNQVVPEVDDKYIAFASKGKAQHSYIRASSYQDEWVNSVAGRLISFFICLANTRWYQRAQCATKCRRIIPSKRWRKKKDDTHSQLPELSAVPGQLGQAVGCTRSETLMAGLRR